MRRPCRLCAGQRHVRLRAAGLRTSLSVVSLALGLLALTCLLAALPMYRRAVPVSDGEAQPERIVE